MAGWNDADGLRWRALDRFGIEIDADLAAPLAASAARRFVALFRDSGLIIAHSQTLTMEQQTALMALLGPVMRRSFENGYISTEIGGNRAELAFHADGAYTPLPLDALSLHAVDVVDGASATRFASAERGYTALPADLREQLAAHSVEMISPSYETLAVRAFEVREPAATRRAERPSVLSNPRTGRSCIGVSEMHAARLNGMEWEESRALIGAIYDHLYAPENTTEHVWHRGDLVIWDNITFQHARASLEGVGRRVLQRVIVGAGEA